LRKAFRLHGGGRNALGFFDRRSFRTGFLFFSSDLSLGESASHLSLDFLHSDLSCLSGQLVQAQCFDFFSRWLSFRFVLGLLGKKFSDGCILGLS
jgi:hypothetical protein